MEKDWNRDDWQGRSRKQVEGNHLIAMGIVAGTVVLLLALIIRTLAQI